MRTLQIILLKRVRRVGARRVVAGGMLVCYLGLLLGIPLPAPVAPSEQAFPCQGHGCGCHTAQQCWEGCCCFTDGQKLAWAKANDAAPPKFLLARMAATKTAAPSVMASAGGCCANDARSAGCETAGGGQTCAAAPHAASCCDDGASPAVPPNRPTLRLVVGIESLKCRGVGANWLTLGDFVPLTAPPSWCPDQVAAPIDGAPLSLSLDLSFPPPAPPPRASRV